MLCLERLLIEASDNVFLPLDLSLIQGDHEWELLFEASDEFFFAPKFVPSMRGP